MDIDNVELNVRDSGRLLNIQNTSSQKAQNEINSTPAHGAGIGKLGGSARADFRAHRALAKLIYVPASY